MGIQHYGKDDDRAIWMERRHRLPPMRAALCEPCASCFLGGFEDVCRVMDVV